METDINFILKKTVKSDSSFLVAVDLGPKINTEDLRRLRKKDESSPNFIESSSMSFSPVGGLDCTLRKLMRKM